MSESKVESKRDSHGLITRRARAAAVLLCAAGAVACTSTPGDLENTASLQEHADLLYSMPGIGGLGILWNGAPNASTGTQISLTDVSFDLSTDTSTIGSTANGQQTANGPESEDLIGYGDFNGDGQTDLLWRTFLTGKLTIWEMSAHHVIKKIASANNVAPYLFSGPAKGYIADLNGDGISDIVWTGVVGSPSSHSFRTLTWIMAADSITPAQTSISDSTTTQVIAVGNFDGDVNFVGTRALGHADFLKSSTDGSVTLVTASGVTTPLGNVSGGWAVKGVGDFNRDFATDVLWYNTQTGDLDVWEGRTSGTMAAQPLLANVPPSWGWTIAGVARVDDNGNSNVFWQQKTDRQTSIWTLADSSHVSDYGTGQAFLGDSIAGVMDVAEPPAPTELSYTVSGSTATLKVKNNNYVKGNKGTTQIEVRHTQGTIDNWNVTTTGLSTHNVPLSWLPQGRNTCIVAVVWYHGRVSGYSNTVCSAS